MMVVHHIRTDTTVDEMEVVAAASFEDALVEVEDEEKEEDDVIQKEVVLRLALLLLLLLPLAEVDNFQFHFVVADAMDEEQVVEEEGRSITTLEGVDNITRDEEDALDFRMMIMNMQVALLQILLLLVDSRKRVTAT